MSLLRKLLIQNSGTRKIPDNTIEYTTTDGNPIRLTQIGSHGIKSNIYSNGKGIITIYGDSITDLGSSSYDSFNNKTTLKTIILPSTITMLYDSFSGCTSLIKCEIQAPEVQIGGSCFYNCKLLKKMNAIINGFYSSSSFYHGSFQYCEMINKITLKEGITSIPDNTFKYCYQADINIPTTITKIGVDAFYLCTSLRSVSLNDGISEIGDGAFAFCTSLSKINIPSNLQKLSDNIFCGTSITSVIVPENIIEIGVYSFGNCSLLKNISLPSTLTTIGSSAFQSCESLESIELPESIIEIGDEVFRDCKRIDLTILSTAPPSIGSDIFYGVQSYTIYVPEASVESYKTAEGWSEFADNIYNKDARSLASHMNRIS